MAITPSAMSVGTLRLGSTRSYTCNMNNEPVSISTLMRPVSTPMVTKAPLHADSAVATGDAADKDSLVPARTTYRPYLTGLHVPYLNPVKIIFITINVRFAVAHD